MVQFCCIIGCGNRSNREITKRFYRLPHVPKYCDLTSYKTDITLRRRKQWLLNIGRADLKDGDAAYSPGYIRICSDHFTSGKPSVWSDLDNIDWAPTVEIPNGYNELKKNDKRRRRKKSSYRVVSKTCSRRGQMKRNTEYKRTLRSQQLQKCMRFLEQISSQVSPPKKLKVRQKLTVKPLIHKITVDSIVKLEE